MKSQVHSNAAILLSLYDVANQISGKLLDARAQKSDIIFEKISTDTRMLLPGDVFLALRGENFNGHNYIESAIEKGAVAVVIDHEWDCDVQKLSVPQLVVGDTLIALGKLASLKRQKFKGQVIAVTGSCGKTTVKGMLNTILNVSNHALATKANLNNQIGVPLTLLGLSNAFDFAIVEAGASQKSDIDYLGKIIEPDISLVNNVMPAHVAGFGSIENIAREKSKLYFHLKENGTAIVNRDSEWGAMFESHINAKKVYDFSVDESKVVNVKASDIHLSEVHTAVFKVDVGNESFPVRLGVLGAHNISNALAAICAARLVGVSQEDIQKGLNAYVGDAGRMQLHTLPNLNVIDDTYNANPGSVASAINYLAHVAQSHMPTFLVLGDLAELGEDAIAEHKKLGKLAAERGVNALFTVGDLAKYAAEGFGENAQHFADQTQLTNTLVNEIKDNAVVLVKGSRSTNMNAVVSMFLEQCAQSNKINKQVVQ